MLKLVKPCHRCKKVAKLDQQFDRLCSDCARRAFEEAEDHRAYFVNLLKKGVDRRMANRIVSVKVDKQARERGEKK